MLSMYFGKHNVAAQKAWRQLFLSYSSLKCLLKFSNKSVLVEEPTVVTNDEINLSILEFCQQRNI